MLAQTSKHCFKRVLYKCLGPNFYTYVDIYAKARPRHQYQKKCLCQTFQHLKQTCNPGRAKLRLIARDPDAKLHYVLQPATKKKTILNGDTNF